MMVIGAVTQQGTYTELKGNLGSVTHQIPHYDGGYKW